MLLQMETEVHVQEELSCLLPEHSIPQLAMDANPAAEFKVSHTPKIHRDSQKGRITAVLIEG